MIPGVTVTISFVDIKELSQVFTRFNPFTTRHSYFTSQLTICIPWCCFSVCFWTQTYCIPAIPGIHWFSFISEWDETPLADCETWMSCDFVTERTPNLRLLLFLPFLNLHTRVCLVCFIWSAHTWLNLRVCCVGQVLLFCVSNAEVLIMQCSIFKPICTETALPHNDGVTLTNINADYATNPIQYMTRVC